MTTQLRFAIPDTTTSLFLVVADGPPNPRAPTAQRGSRPGAVVWRAEESPFDLRQVRQYAIGEQPLPPPSAYHLIVSATAPTRNHPRDAQDARSYARVLAAQTHGVLIDWATQEAVLAALRPERARFHLGDQWLGFDLRSYEDRHVGLPMRDPWQDLPRTRDACGANRIQTPGLARFGLPELVIDEVDCEHHLTALNVVRALAQHLLTQHWAWLYDRAAVPGQATTRRIATEHQVSGNAFAAYWGASLSDASPFAVSLTASARRLRVQAPHGEPLNDWLAIHWSNLRTLAACPPDDHEAYAHHQPRGGQR